MAMSAAALESAMYTSIYTNLKALMEPKIPTDADAGQRADADQNWKDIATAVSKAAADIVTEVIKADVQTTIPAASFCTAATGCVLNPAPIPVTGTVTS